MEILYIYCVLVLYLPSPCLPLLCAVFGEDDGASVVHGITFFQDHVYFTDPATNSIWKSDRVGEKSVYLDGYDYLSDIRVVQQNLGENRILGKPVHQVHYEM